MTVAIGMLTDQGPLLCTDTQYTGVSKANRDKILFFTEHFTAACFALTGNEANARMAFQESVLAIRAIPEKQRTVDALRRVIRRTIKPIYDQYVTQLPADARGMADFDFIIALGAIGEGPGRLFYTEQGAIVEVDRYVCRGTGGYLAEYFLKSTWRPSIPFNRGVLAAMQALAVAKEHDAYCGGDSQFASLRSGFTSGLVPFNVRQTEAIILRYQELANQLIGDVGDLELGDDAFTSLITQHVENVRALRQSIRSHATDWNELVRA
ncbi:MAG TPA: hypothetical protein VNE16_01015, partial [Vicinamibacterales bacterium]|nr:hypothetical protein [Vicinamibacterales bacterium]